MKKGHKDKEYMLHPATFLGPALRFRDYLTDQPEEEVPESREDTWANPFAKWREDA